MGEPRTRAGPNMAEDSTALFDPADFVSELHDEGLWPLNAGGDPQVPDSSTSDDVQNGGNDHLNAYLM